MANQSLLSVYIPMDRRQAIFVGKSFPENMTGSVLFADISGFTPLTAALNQTLGKRRSVDELTQLVNRVFTVLITQVHHYQGSVTGFGGDALTCWFMDDNGLRAAACALAMQIAMREFASIEGMINEPIALTLKIGVTVGSIRRFCVGDPQIQLLDILTGPAMMRLAQVVRHAEKGRVVIDEAISLQIGDKLSVEEWRKDPEGHQQVAFITSIKPGVKVETTSWPDLTPMMPAQRTVDNANLRSWLLGPVFERLQSSAGKFLAEIRPVVVLFLRFAGLDYVQDTDVGTKLNAYIQWVQQTLAQYEGYLLKLTIDDKGSYILAAFGAPLAHEDDLDRALATALILRSSSTSFPFLDPVQIGVSQGGMLAGAFGSTTRAAYDLLGNEANIANRLMMLAQPGQILVSHHVRQAAGRSHRFSLPKQSVIKGLRDPMPVYELLGHEYVLPLAFTRRLIGRECELQQMETLLLEAKKGQGRLLRVEGAAGMGKSHLIAVFLERALHAGCKVASGICEVSSRNMPYYPWHPLWRALLGLASPSPEKPSQVGNPESPQQQLERLIQTIDSNWLYLTPLLGEFLGIAMPTNSTLATYDAQRRREALFMLLNALLLKQMSEQPLVLVLEDIHWLDEASFELLKALQHRIITGPVLLILAHRPLTVTHEGLLRLASLKRLPVQLELTLGELTLESLNAVVAEHLLGRPSPLVLSLILALAQGNPYYIEELVTAWQARGWLQYDNEEECWHVSQTMFQALQSANCLTKEITSGEWVVAVSADLSAAALETPTALEQLVLSRVDRMAEEQRLTLKVASIIGHIFTLDLLAESHPRHPSSAQLQKQLRELEEHKLIYLEEGTFNLHYTFKHAITQEAIYRALIEGERRQLHQAVGAALEALDPQAIERLAYHYRQGAIVDKSLHYLDLAAHKAQRAYANQIALNYFNQALELKERWGWLKGKAEVLHILADREAERATLERLHHSLAPPDFTVAYLWGQYYEATGDYVQAQSHVEDARQFYETQANQVGVMLCLTLLGQIARRYGDYTQAKQRYVDALTIETNAEATADKAQVLIQIYNGLAILCRQQGQYDEAVIYSKRAAKLSQVSGNRSGEAEALNTLGAIAFYQRDFEIALNYHRQVLQIRRMIGDLAGEGTSLYNIAVAFHEQGNYTEAGEYLSEALVVLQNSENRWEEVNVRNVLGVLAYLLGDFTTAQEHLQAGLALSQALGDKAGEAYLLCNLGQVARDQGLLAIAAQWLSTSFALAETQQDKQLSAMCQSHLALVYLAAGEVDQACKYARAALGLRRQLDLAPLTTIDRTTIARACWLLNKPKQALSQVQATLKQLKKCNEIGPEFPHWDFYHCFQILQAAGQYTDALAALHAAHRLLTQRTQQISDIAQRATFLTNVPINRAIVDAVNVLDD